MAKETMLTYLDEQLTKRLPDYDVAIDWDVKNHTVELVIRLFAENPTKLHLDDAQGVASEEEVIEFEEAVFELKWDRERFAAIVRENEAKGQTAYLPYPAY